MSFLIWGFPSIRLNMKDCRAEVKGQAGSAQLVLARQVEGPISLVQATASAPLLIWCWDGQWSACSEKTIKTSDINGRNWDTRYLFLPAKVLHNCCWARWTYWDCDLVFCHLPAPTELWDFLLEEQWCSEVCWTCLASGWDSSSWGWTCSDIEQRNPGSPEYGHGQLICLREGLGREGRSTRWLKIWLLSYSQQLSLTLSDRVFIYSCCFITEKSTSSF